MKIKLLSYFIKNDFPCLITNYYKFRLINYDLLLGEIFKTKGEKEEKDAKTFNLFYDFDPGTKNPLLLFLKNN